MAAGEDGSTTGSQNQSRPMDVDQVTEREYQTYLINEAKKRNVIVCLPTGAGKTLIAVQLTKFYLPEAIRQKKKIIFTANTIPLVKQQAAYFRTHLCNGFLNEESNFVDYLTGDRGIDFKKSSNGSEFFNRDGIHVLFSTPQILVDAMNHGYLTFDRIRFLVVDECHNSDKDHPMNLLMQLYTRQYIGGDKTRLPRVVGLTATIINGKKRAEEIQLEVKEAENRLCAKALTYYDQLVVSQFSTSAHKNIEYVEYWKENTWPEFDGIIEELKELQTNISALPSCVFKTMEEQLQEQEVNHPTFQDGRQLLSSGSSLKKELKAILRDVIDVYEDLGPYGSWLAAIHKRASLEPLRRRLHQNQMLTSVITVIVTSLEKFSSSMEREFNRDDRSMVLQDKITKKVNELLRILKKFEVTSSDDKNSLCGIIFVEKRITAQVLSWYLEDLANVVTIYKFLKPAFAIGVNAFRLEPAIIRSTMTEQARILDEFHKKNYNLLVATKVIEEGLNVPRCNLVVRWDKINSFPSYIQSMGRARAKQSSFIAFINGEEQEKEKQQYASFQQFNSRLVNYLVTNNAACEDFYSSDDEIPPYEPVPGCEPRITAQAAISIANRYCQMLPCDKLSSLVPVSWWVDVTESQEGAPSPGKAYKVYIRFPRNSVIREVVEGDTYATKSIAKRSAFLRACKLLHERGALNENLLPIRRSATADITKFIENSFKVKQKTPHVKGEYSWHRKRIPGLMAESNVLPKRKTNCYRIIIELNEQSVCDPELRGLYLFGECKYSYGIVTAIDLSFVPEIQLNVNTSVGSLRMRLEQIHLSDRVAGLYLSREEILKLQNFERYLFGDLLSLKQWYMEQAAVDASSLIVVPLMNTLNFHNIHWSLIEEILKSACDVEPVLLPFQYQQSRYTDAVVIPHYVEDRRLYAVIDVLQGMSPLSQMDCNKAYANYKAYFYDKYQAVITDENQRLLRCKQISDNLNYFTPGAQFKKSKEERRLQRGNAVELVPELVQIHKMPASLYIMAKMLPSILQRIYRYACVVELHSRVLPDGLPQSIPENEALEKNQCKVICTTSGNYDDLASPQSGFETHSRSNGFRKAESTSAKRITSGMENSDRLILDFIHPGRIQLDFFPPENKVPLHKALTWSKRNPSGNTGAAIFDSLKLAHHLVSETDIVLENREASKLKLDCRQRVIDVVPTSFSLMEAITKHGSNDVVNLERFEVMGDAFLKYQVSRHMYCYFPKYDEGLLTQWRSFFISNKCLYPSGVRLNLNEYLAGGVFWPRSCWLPQSFSIPEELSAMTTKYDMTESALNDLTNEEQEAVTSPNGLVEYMKSMKEKPKPSCAPGNSGYSYVKMSNKSVADCVEAVIGVYFSESGFDAALQAMKTLAIEAPVPDETGNPTTLRKNLEDYVPTPSLDHVFNETRVDDLLPFYQQLEGLLQYQFKNPWLLVEAFTHAGTCKNEVTGSYQRLEYLGDAVLDFLISCHIFRANPNLNPGEITDLRSALVNNVTFASLAVRYGLHTYLLHESKLLQSSIDVFVEHQKRVKHHVTGHFRLLSDNDAKGLLAQDIEVPKVLGDLFESLAGAVYIDSDMSLDETWSVFFRLMKHEIDTFSKNPPKSPVRQLYERFPSRKLFENMEDYEDSSSQDYELPKLQYQRLVVPLQHPRTKEMFCIIGCGNNKESAKLGAAKYFWHLDQMGSETRS